MRYQLTFALLGLAVLAIPKPLRRWHIVVGSICFVAACACASRLSPAGEWLSERAGGGFYIGVLLGIALGTRVIRDSRGKSPQGCLPELLAIALVFLFGIGCCSVGQMLS